MNFDYVFQGNRIGNQIGKLVVEFIKSHINPHPSTANLPLSSQILSTQGISTGFNRPVPANSLRESPRQLSQGFDRSPPTQTFGSLPAPLRELPTRHITPALAASPFVSGHPGIQNQPRL